MGFSTAVPNFIETTPKDARGGTDRVGRGLLLFYSLAHLRRDNCSDLVPLTGFVRPRQVVADLRRSSGRIGWDPDDCCARLTTRKGSRKGLESIRKYFPSG